MSEIAIKDFKLNFIDINNRKIEMWDFDNYFGNKSLIPMHSFNNDQELVAPNILINMIEEHKKLFSVEFVINYILADILVMIKFFSSVKPFKICIFGCDDGIISYHIAKLSGIYNKKNDLVLLGDFIDSHYLDLLNTIEEKPKISFCKCNYENTYFESEIFDIVLINGSINFTDNYSVIKEAERLVKKDGELICICNESPLLESCFKMIFDDWDEYVVDLQKSVLKAQLSSTSWNRKTEIFKDRYNEFLEELRTAISNNSTIDELRSFSHRANVLTDFAIKECEIDDKLNLIIIRERIIDCILNYDSDEYSEFKDILIKSI